MWIKLDDLFPDHPKVVEAGPLAGWLYVCGLCYAARYLTDGFIPRGQVRKLADLDDPMALAEKLVQAGLWEQAEAGYIIHDFLEYNPSAQQIKEQRHATATRQQKWRDEHGRYTQEHNAVSNASHNALLTSAPSPSPSPKDLSSERIKKIYQDETGRTLTDAGFAIIATVTDYALFKRCLRAWVGAGYNPGNLAGVMDWYKRGSPPRKNGKAVEYVAEDYTLTARETSQEQRDDNKLLTAWARARERLMAAGLAGPFNGATPLEIKDGFIVVSPTTENIEWFTTSPRAGTLIEHARKLQIIVQTDVQTERKES